MANDFVACLMNRVKPGDIVSVRVISIDEKRGRIGFSMKPESEKPVRPAAKASESTSNDDKAIRPRSNRSSADKRPSKPRGNRQDKDNANNRVKAPRTEKAVASSKQAPSKIGTLGALLKEAGVTKAKE